MKSRLAPYRGPVAKVPPARTQAAALRASVDKEAVTTALAALLDGFDERRQRDRLQEAARQIANGLRKLQGLSCSAVSHGPGATVIAIKGGGERG